MRSVGYYIINEGKEEEVTPRVISSSKSVVRFRVDVLQEADRLNRNSRTYPWEVLVAGCQTPFIREKLENKSLFCEIGHPIEQTAARQTLIDRRNAACMITELTFNRPCVGGVVETLATQLGRDMMGLILENGCKVAFSMRGIGKVVEEGKTVRVVGPLNIINWDEVNHPSVERAYMSSLTEATVQAGGHGSDRGAMMSLTEEVALLALRGTPEAMAVLETCGVEPGPGRASLTAEGNVAVAGDGVTAVVLTNGKIRRDVSAYLAGL